MGREIQRECDWHFCSGPHLCHQQEGPEGQRWAKSHTWPLQVERNHLNHDYDLKKQFKCIWKSAHPFLKVSLDLVRVCCIFVPVTLTLHPEAAQRTMCDSIYRDTIV